MRQPDVHVPPSGSAEEAQVAQGGRGGVGYEPVSAGPGVTCTSVWEQEGIRADKARPPSHSSSQHAGGPMRTVGRGMG